MGTQLQAQKTEIVDAMSATMAREIADLLATDPVLRDMLWESVESNVTTILYGLSASVPISHLQPPSAAVEYARRLAQRGIPPNSLVRAYHMGQNDMINLFYSIVEEIELSHELTIEVLRYASALVYEYIDWISQYVFDVYERERNLWLGTAGNIRSALIHSVLRDPRGGADAFETQTGYRLDQHHLGAVVWTDAEKASTPAALDSVATGLARAVGPTGPPLSTAVDQETLWAWIPLGQHPPRLDTASLRESLSLPADLRISLGLPAEGAHGFQRSHEQAIAAYEVATMQHSPTSAIVGFGDRGIALTSLLAGNLDSTRAWVGEVLGRLADDTENAAVLRQTLRTFFATGESHLRTAEQLNLHRNTVKYRVDKALAGPRIHDRLDIALALQVCEFLGPTVLRH
ncbi:PucR family transcriptional regulator [Gordonia araii NBRC 100433]|nr:helix-turn-helix domain-containing protein [Gordonia araii]NNG98272.1 PucR family transcriptional regulator [Gordonia araii NBRC 100433]